MTQHGKPQVFRAATAREAGRKVREALGDDALVLSNRSIGTETEIVAISPKDIDKWTHGAAAAPISAPAAAPAPVSKPIPVAAPVTTPILTASAAPTSLAPSPARPISAPVFSVPQSSETENHMLLQEIKAMRQTLESQLATMAWQQNQIDPGRKAVAKAMLNAGFSPLLARTLSGYTKPGTEAAQALQWLRTGLAKHLQIANQEIIDEGGIFALVGPTGVGKTTTTAKIAARCAMRYGAKSFTLITTDTYRLAAEAQLAGFGKILGSPVHTVSSADDLKDTIEDLKNKRLILIDTVGMSQRDQRVSEQIAMLVKAGRVKRVLVLNCATSGAVLDDVANIYSHESHGGLHGAILTKSDESVHLGSALDVLIRRKLPLLYVTTGQRVPEDIILPNATDLIEKAFAVTGSNPFSMSDFDLQMGVN